MVSVLGGHWGRCHVAVVWVSPWWSVHVQDGSAERGLPPASATDLWVALVMSPILSEPVCPLVPVLGSLGTRCPGKGQRSPAVRGRHLPPGASIIEIINFLC